MCENVPLASEVAGVILKKTTQCASGLTLQGRVCSAEPSHMGDVPEMY